MSTTATPLSGSETTSAPARSLSSTEQGLVSRYGSADTPASGAPEETRQETETPETETTTETEGGEGGEGQESTEAPEGGETPTDEEGWIQHYAKVHNLDPENPDQRKVLKMLAHKELHIQKITAERDSLKQGSDTEAGLTEYEKTLKQKAQSKTEAPKEETRTEAETEPEPTREAVGQDWMRPEDAIVDEAKAWADEKLSEGDRLKRINKIRQGQFAIHMAEFAPQLKEFIQKQITEAVGDVLPDAAQVAQRQRTTEAREFALGELAKVKGFENVRELTKPQEGPPVEVEGQKWPNTLLNRIIAENPEILKIHEDGESDAEALRLTMISRFRMAWNIHRRSALTNGTASKLVKAGAEIGKRTEGESIRQGLNAGGGASSRGKPQETKWADRVRGGPGGMLNLADLFN